MATKSKKLAYSVTLWNAKAGQYETFLPGEELPSWAAGMVKNPVAFQEEESQPTAGSEDLVVPGPSQYAHQENADLVTKARMATGSQSARGSGIPAKEKGIRADSVNPQPSMHDEVAKNAVGKVLWPSEAAEKAFQLRQGVIPSEQDLRNAEQLEEDQKMNEKADKQLEEFAAQQAETAFEQAMQVQAAASVQAGAALAAVPGAQDRVLEANEAKADVAKKAAAKKSAADKDDK